MDINRVIMESIQSVVDKDELITEKTAFGKEDVVEKISKTGEKLKKGTAFDSANTTDPNAYESSPGHRGTVSDDSVSNYVPSTGGKFDWSDIGKKGAFGAAAIAAGLGAVTLAKKLRGAKKAAKAKA